MVFFGQSVLSRSLNTYIHTSGRAFAYPAGGMSSIWNMSQDIMAEINVLRHSDGLHSSSINGGKKVISLAVPETDAYACVLLKTPLD